MPPRLLSATILVFAFGSAASAQGPTYAKEVAPIIQAKCHICHRDGDIAPFSLNTYDQAVAWSEDIARDVTSGAMPPWKPVAGFGNFRDSYALTADEKQTILDWIANGTPLGNPDDLPEAPPDNGPWTLGAPDITLQVPAPFTPNRGKDV